MFAEGSLPPAAAAAAAEAEAAAGAEVDTLQARVAELEAMMASLVEQNKVRAAGAVRATRRKAMCMSSSNKACDARALQRSAPLQAATTHATCGMLCGRG